MKVISGGVTAPIGFFAAGVHAGIKKVKKDMALIYSQKPCKAAGVFTTNVVKAAPVKWDKDIVEHSPFAQAIVINSGVANACTGIEGLKACSDMALETANVLNIPHSCVLVASTGVHFKSVDELPGEVLKMWEKTGNLKQAYLAVQGESLITKQTGNKNGDLSHLANPGAVGTGTNVRPLTQSEKDIWRMVNPDITDEELNKKTMPVT